MHPSFTPTCSPAIPPGLTTERPTRALGDRKALGRRFTNAVGHPEAGACCSEFPVANGGDNGDMLGVAPAHHGYVGATDIRLRESVTERRFNLKESTVGSR